MNAHAVSPQRPGDSSRCGGGGEIAVAGSTLVAIGALLGVKILRRHAEHLVALDADAMDNARGVAQGGVFRGMRRVVGCSLMGGILA